MALYERFYNHLTKCLQDRDAFNHFKSADDLDYMTEHRGLDQFKDGFLQQILTHCRMLNLNVDTVLTRCQINDRDGAPFLSTIQYHDRTYHISPNTLRYIDKGLHMLLLFNHFRNQSIKILELGAGYGGQRLILGVLCDLLQIKIDLYTIIDYPQVCQFCQYYLKQVDIDVDILCYDNGHMKDLST